MPIEFSCPRCQHPQSADESKIGQHVYCQVCYFTLTVPGESTNKPIDESKLYTLDAQPWNREDRPELISFPCNLCHTNIGVRKEQVGEEIACPECGQKIIVPELVAEIAEKKIKDKLDKAREALSPKATYSLRNGLSAPPEEGVKPIRFLCRLCGTALFATDEQVGSLITCPDCTTKTKVPPRAIKTEAAPLPPPVEFEGNTAFDVAMSSTPGTKENLVPVVCHLCGTRMYAKESQIRQFKTCPDCGQQTEIKTVPKHMMTTTETTSADAYGIGKAGTRPTFRTLTDWRNVEGSLAKEIRDEQRSNRGRNKQASNRSFNRPPLPKRPLTERFFVPFGASETWLRLMLFVATGPLGPMVVILPALFLEMGPMGGLWATVLALPLFFMYVFACCLFATFLLHFYNFTSSGMDDGVFKGEIAPFDYFINGLWLFAFSFIAVLPGCFVGNFLYSLWGSPFVLYVSIRMSFGIFFPIFLLSSIEEGSMFAVFTKNTLVSLYRQPFAWLRFYLLTGILFALSDLCLVGVVWLGDSAGTSFSVFMTITIVFFLLGIQALFFFRLLGRLAWLLEETDRQRRELEYEEEEIEE